VYSLYSGSRAGSRSMQAASSTTSRANRADSHARSPAASTTDDASCEAAWGGRSSGRAASVGATAVTGSTATGCRAASVGATGGTVVGARAGVGEMSPGTSTWNATPTPGVWLAPRARARSQTARRAVMRTAPHPVVQPSSSRGITLTV
jgi:hypothetical protein